MRIRHSLVLVGAVALSAALTMPVGATTLAAGRSTAPAVAAAPHSDPPQTPPRVMTGNTITHDPALAKTSYGWYIYNTGDPALNGGALGIRSSMDGGTTWRYRGTVTPGIPQWVQDAVPGVTNLWAPDLSRHNGLWYLYYAASTFGSNRSIIGLMTSPTLEPSSPDYRWTDRGLVLESFTTDDYNAIDPSVSMDNRGRAWLSFGSFWSGIKMARISFPSGKPANAHPAHVDLVDRMVPPNAVEAPYVVSHGGWYYLFASFDFCCQGINSSYREVVGRSRTITGPYVDRDGLRLDNGGGSPFLDASGSMRGPGGVSISGNALAFHYYDAGDNGTPHIGLGHLAYRNGWPVLTNIRISKLGSDG